MGFRKKNAKLSDNRSSAKVIMGKPASQLTKEEKKILSARMAEIRSASGGKNTVQNTIPFLSMYKDGVCQVSENFFSLTVQFFDANYSIAEFDEQNNIFSKYCDVINLFDNTIRFQLTFENQNRSKAKLVKTVQIPEQDDDFNAIRKEYSEMLTDKLLKGSNGQSARKFLTFGIESTSYKAARAKLMSIKNDVIKCFKAFGVEAELLDGRQRLEALYYALNPYRNSPFLFDWGEMLRAGMDTKDFICPPSLKFNKADFEIGNAYGAVWGMNILAGELPDEILKDFLEMQNLFCVNIHVEPLDQIDALKFVKKKLTNVEQMKIDEQKKASQSGYDPDILPPAIKMYIEDIDKLLADLNSKNERLFHISISIRAYAKSKKSLKLQAEMLKRICQKNNCTMFPYDYRQEQTLVSTLPLCYNEIPVRREMHTSGIAIFVPFTTKELFQDGQATYYGINTLSGNMIRANRSRLKNPNGLILGTPGAGKSFSVKREILDCFLTTPDDIIICDPEGEYFPLVSALHGQLIRIASNSEQHINPMDITIDDYMFSNPMEVIANKSDFLISLCEIIVGGRYGLSAEERSVIDKCVQRIYKHFIENEPSAETMPLLSDLQRELHEEGEVALRVANSLEMFVNGSQNLFNHRTNIDMSNRIICFDIKELGNQLKKVGMLIVQDTVWNRVSANREKKKITRYYIDEFHLLLKEEQTAKYSAEIWKRFRKWGGVPTGITQNVKDLLSSQEVENIFDNRDKSLISMQLADFQRVRDTLERSGINYYAYEMNGTVRMAVNDKDTDWLRNILGNVSITKSNRPYSPPEKNIFGSAEYRYISQKEYLSADRDLVLKMAEIMKARGMQFSGRVYPSGKGTLTVSHADLFAVRNIRDEVVNMRKQFASPDKAQEVGNRDYRANRDTHYYMSKLTPEQFGEVKPFLETSVSYHAVVRDGKVAFAVDKENAPAFHRALENAVRETNMLRKMADLGLPMEQNIALSPVVHRLAVEDMQLDLADFFDKRYDEAQFGEMLSLVNAYIAQAPAERYGENSKLTDMLEAKSSFDRSIELSDFFSLHDFSDEQRAAITAMFVGDVTRGQIDSIDETFTAEDIQAYDEILHNALQESDIEDFLAEHAHSVQKQSDRDQALADAFASHKDMQLSGSGDDLTNFRLHYDTEINNGEGGYNLIADRIAVPLIKDMSISVLSDDISFDTFKDFLSSHDLAFESVIDTIKPEKQATEEEVLFSNADLARFLAEHTLSSDEWEDMASPLFERGYLEKHQPSDKASFGYHLPEKELYALAERYHHGDDIRRELALGLMIHASDNIADKDKVEFVFEDGKISDRTFYYGENLRHTMDLSYGDDGITCSFSGMERFVSFEEIGQAFIDRIHEEYEDLAYWAVLDYIKDDIPDISDDTVKELITAFDGAALHGWENGDNNPKLNRIKKALFEVLGNEDQTEKAFACIAKHKYNVTFEAEKPEKQPDSLTFHFGKDKGDEWVSESDIVHDFALTHPDCSFALGNAVLEYLDEKQHSERNIPELKAGWYKKTDFSISAVIGGEEFNYDGRFDIGDGKGTGGGSLIDHIRTYNEGFLGYTQHPFNQPEYKERAQRMLDIFVPFLEAHSELTAEEQRIFDDFKAQHPIRTYDDVEKAQGTFKIYQLPSGEKYHGVRFEDMEQLKRDGVQLNHDDYELVYEGEVGEFRGNATLEALYTQFNTDHPEEFRGHSLSVSDVIVISVDGKDTAYFCDSFGFTEMPEFFREKEIGLRDIVDRFITEGNSVIETPDGEWRIAGGGYDLVAEIYHYNTPVCGIINAVGGYEVNAYQGDADIVKTVTDVLSEHGITVISSVEDISKDVDISDMIIVLDILKKIYSHTRQTFLNSARNRSDPIFRD